VEDTGNAREAQFDMAMPRFGVLHLAASIFVSLGYLSLILADDSTQLHCEGDCTTDPPFCMTATQYGVSDCPFDSNTISSCEYRHCHVQAIGCWDWWTILNLTCLCDPLTENSCASNCKKNLPSVAYLNWMAITCADSSWGFAAGETFQFPDNADLTYLDEIPSTPACFSAQDQQDLALCLFSPSEVSSWAPAGYDVDTGASVVLDRDCYCGTFSYTDTMKRSSCGDATDLSLTQSLVFLDSYCGNYPGFAASQLPNDWQDMLLLSNSTFPSINNMLRSWQHSQTPTNSDSSCAQIFSNLTQHCETGQRCSDQSVDGCNAAVDTFSQSCFCGTFVFPATLQGADCYEEDIGYSEALLWLDENCNGISSFDSELPADWHDLILTVNATFISADQNSLWPDCLDQNQCASQGLSDSGAGLRFDPSVFSDSSVYPEDTVNTSQFCGIIRYSGQCARQCVTPWWDRVSVLDYLLKTCGPVSTQAADAQPYFPADYELLHSIQASELLPWTWAEIRPDNLTVNASSNDIVDLKTHHYCPSAAGKLASFAIVNCIMALILPIIGRRTLINRLTLGRLGRSNSRFWIYTGALGIGLHITSNAVNASIIKATPGYSHVSVPHLTLLWCTRPRLSWLVVALVPFQARKAMYFSVTASTLIAESVLQIIGAVYMGIATNFARNNRFYQPRSLDKFGGVRGHDAQIMYGGSLLWLCVFPFAVMACTWSILGISTHLRSLSIYLTEMASTAKRLRSLASSQIAQLDTTGDLAPAGTPDDFQAHYRTLSTYRNNLLTDWQLLEATCKEIPGNLRQERRLRITFIRQLEENGQGTDINFNEPWFTGPPHSGALAIDEANNASGATRPIQTATRPLEEALQGCRDRILGLEAQEKALRQQIRDLKASAKTRIKAEKKKEKAEENLLKRLAKSLNPGQRTSQTANLLSLEEQEPLAALEHQLHHIRTQQTLLAVHLTHLQRICATSTRLLEVGAQLSASWTDLASSWDVVAEERQKEARAQMNPATFAKIPMIVVSGMLITWIAQWLWWVGYIRVAADTYCPPKLPLLTLVWTSFSASGATIGASF
jgi:hypothetical protein